MTGVLVALGVILLWLGKQSVGALISQQLKGSVPDYTAGRARAAARLLPDDLAEEYERDWLAELYELKEKPLSAILFARGLPRAARAIAGQRDMEALKAGEGRLLRRPEPMKVAHRVRLSARFFVVILFDSFMASYILFIVIALIASTLHFGFPFSNALNLRLGMPVQIVFSTGSFGLLFWCLKPTVLTAVDVTVDEWKSFRQEVKSTR